MIGEKIQEHREKKNLTQTQLGVLIGLGQSTIAMYERNKIMPSSKRLPELASALGVSINELYAPTESTLPTA